MQPLSSSVFPESSSFIVFFLLNIFKVSFAFSSPSHLRGCIALLEGRMILKRKISSFECKCIKLNKTLQPENQTLISNFKHLNNIFVLVCFVLMSQEKVMNSSSSNYRLNGRCDQVHQPWNGSQYRKKKFNQSYLIEYHWILQPCEGNQSRRKTSN